LFLHYHQVYRIKGFVKFKGEEKAVLVQSTGKNVTFSEVKENPPELVLVFIGKDIERKGLERMIFGI
jgi:G3E family GTPase